MGKLEVVIYKSKAKQKSNRHKAHRLHKLAKKKEDEALIKQIKDRRGEMGNSCLPLYSSLCWSLGILVFFSIIVVKYSIVLLFSILRTIVLQIPEKTRTNI